jgi:hypothetical protein
MRLLIAVILVLLLIGALPAWPYASGWGWGPSGLIGLLLIIVVIYYIFGGPRSAPPDPLP